LYVATTYTTNHPSTQQKIQTTDKQQNIFNDSLLVLLNAAIRRNVLGGVVGLGGSGAHCCVGDCMGMHIFIIIDEALENVYVLFFVIGCVMSFARSIIKFFFFLSYLST